MNKKLSKFLLTSASAAALLAAYPAVAQNANEAGFDLPAVTAQAATSRTAFLRAARELPSVANITANDVTNVRAVRGLYNGLSAADKANAEVQRWEGYLSDKEAALPVDAAAFIRAANALPAVSDIRESHRADIAVVREMYNQLPASDRNRADVQRWVGYVQQKVAALPSDAAAQFIVEARALPNLSEIAGMNASQFAQAKVDIQAARSTYRQLNAAQRADTDVSRWAGYLSKKEAAFGITFQLSARALPTLGEIAEMTDAQLLTAQANAARTRSLYNDLSAVAKADAAVSRWEGFLTAKEEAIAARLAGEEPVDPEEPTTPELTLAEAKTEGIRELESYGDLSDYDYFGLRRVNFVIRRASNLIDNATSVARVNALVEDAKQNIDDVPTAEERNNADIVEALRDARAFLARQDVNDYAEEDQEAYYEIVADAEAALGTVRSSDRVYTIINDTNQALIDLKAAGTEDQAALADAVRKAQADINAYQRTIGTSLPLSNYIARRNPQSIERVETLKAEAITQIDEALAGHKVSRKADLEAYAALETYTVNKDAVDAVVAEALANIDAATSVSGIENAVSAAVKAIDEIDTDNEITYQARQAVDKLEGLARDGKLTQADIDAAKVAVESMPEGTEDIEQLNVRIANVQAALNAVNTIQALPAEADVTFADEADIIAARTEFNAVPHADHVPENVRQRLHRAEVALKALRDNAVIKFRNEVNTLPLATDVPAMNQATLTQTATAAATARATYNALPATLLENEIVVEREAVLTAVENAVVKRQTQILLNSALPAVEKAETAVEALTLNSPDSAILAAQEAMDEARALVNKLPASSDDFKDLDFRLTRAQNTLNLFK